jgi:GxxExxY protein
MITDQKIKHADITEEIIEAFYAVYNELGYGFLESVYENAMVIVLRQVGLRVEQQVAIPVFFRGQIVGDYRCDLLVEGKVLIELKAVKEIAPEHVSQTLNYLKATEIEVAMILNFVEKPVCKRLLFDNARKNRRILTGTTGLTLRE